MVLYGELVLVKGIYFIVMQEETSHHSYCFQIVNEDGETFSKEHNVELNSSKGDIIIIPFEDELIIYIYLYNTILIIISKKLKHILKI